MESFDLMSQPSTADVLMGARARGQPVQRDPRAVIELDDFDFNPNAQPLTEPRSTSSCMKDPTTGLDIVDPEELKKRIRGEGSLPPIVERFRRQAADNASAVVLACAEKAKEQPRVSLGLFVSVGLLVMFGCIYAMATRPPDSTVPAAHLRPDSHRSSASTASAGRAVDEVTVENAAQVLDESNGEEAQTSVASIMNWGNEFLALKKQNKGMMSELKMVRSEVAELKELLKSLYQAPSASAEMKLPRAQSAATQQVEEDGAREVRKEMQVGKQAAASSLPGRPAQSAEPTQDEPTTLEDSEGLGEVRVESQKTADEPRPEVAASGVKPSSGGGWSVIFAR
mmetsp:Transcript_60913/g.108173  ORF Transcript_60913/g.108173 Transcript_60913/m.108173 type:complete len:340 (+) Transcript_60913:77-1096(+)